MATEKNSRWGGDAVAEGFTKALAYHFTLTYIVPIGAVLLPGIIGYFSKIPWFWILLGMLAAFAFISNGLLRFNEWLYLRRVEDKLTFGSVLVGRSIQNDGIIIGVQLNNCATFPIEFEITEIRTRLGTTVPNKTHKLLNIIVSPNGYGWYYDNPIQLPTPPPATLEGFIEYTIKYGKSGALKYSIIGKKQIVASFSNEGLFVNAVWHNAA